MPTDPTYYTIANAPFFPGLVALLNSLRLSGNEGELVVLDRGLEPGQRARLEPHARVVDLSREAAGHPTLQKPYPQVFEPSGVIVIVDSDMAVVRSLDPIVERAGAGRICVFPDPIPDRWFAEWAEALGLREPLRRETYVNAGFVAFSVEHWPDLLARWWELCAPHPVGGVHERAGRALLGRRPGRPQRAPLERGSPGGAEELPVTGEAYPEQQLRVRVKDARSLQCELDGEPVTILHHSLGPKVWQRHGWLRLRTDAYVRLLPRLWFADDVPLRLDEGEVPFRLRHGAAPRAVRSTLDAAHGGVRAVVACDSRPVTPGPGRPAEPSPPPARRLRAGRPPRARRPRRRSRAKGRPERSAIASRSCAPSERFSTQSSAPSANEPPPTER